MFHENAQFNFRIHLFPKTRHLQLGNYYLLLHIVGHGVTSLKLGARLFSLARILRCISPDVVVMGLSFASLWTRPGARQMSCLLQCCIDRILKGKSSMFGLKARGEQLGFWQVTFPLSFSTLLLYLAWILISQDCQAVMPQGLTLTLVPRKPWLDSKGKHIYYASSAYRQFLVTTTKQSCCTVWMFGGDTFPH